MRIEYNVTGFIVKDYNVLLVHHKSIGKWIPPTAASGKNEVFDDMLQKEIKRQTNLDVDIISQGTDLRKEKNPLGKEVTRILANPFNVHVSKNKTNTILTICYICNIKNDSEEMELNAELKGAEWFGKGDFLESNIPKEIKQLCMLALELSIDNL